VKHHNQLICGRGLCKNPCRDQDAEVGLSWREETELRKALYASMQEQKQHREKGDNSADDVLTADTGTWHCMSTTLVRGTACPRHWYVALHVHDTGTWHCMSTTLVRGSACPRHWYVALHVHLAVCYAVVKEGLKKWGNCMSLSFLISPFYLSFPSFPFYSPSPLPPVA